jgi:CheY-like chemotaxis protein
MDGLELTRRLKSDARYRDVIVIALTAYAMKGDDEKAFRAGCDGYLSSTILVVEDDLPAIMDAVQQGARGAAEEPSDAPKLKHAQRVILHRSCLVIRIGWTGSSRASQ